MSARHYLKTWPTFFDAVSRGDKNFEVRKDDRAFQAGDTLILEYFDPDPTPPGEIKMSVPLSIVRVVTYVLRGGQFGIEAGFVVLGLAEPDQGEDR